MKHEFKVTRSKEQTVYTLESATGGGTSVNAIASMDSELGGIQRRNPPGDNILAQEKKETPKPRNFVAKNAKMGGAGQHKDKKKAAKQGDVKHKKPLGEEWSQKYKSSINCSHPKGFSQKAHCAGKKKHEESTMTMEAVCPDCGMCQTHGNVMEIKKGQKDANGFTRCWPGKHAVGTKKGKNGGQVRDCRPNEGVAEDHEIQMASSELQSIAKNAVHLLDLVRKYSEEQGLDAWQQSKITKAADYLNAVLQSISGEQSNLESGMPEDTYMESLMNMLERSVSQAQHNLMVGVAHNPQFAQKVKVKQKVGQEFARADQGHDISKLPIRVPKKK